MCAARRRRLMARRGTRDHAADAGGDPAVLEAKSALRAQIWDALQDAGAARFPGAHGRIPNFTGAEAAAERLRDTDAWRGAATMKANPDSPQWPVRQRAVEDGMLLFMAVPRLADARPFFLIDPQSLAVPARKATSIKGAGAHARAVDVADLEPVDLVVVGCVAVDRTGARLGKGGGFSDLEFAIASAAGLVDDHTLVVTTVHARQVVAPGRVPVSRHDVMLDLVVTPDEVIVCERVRARPDRILWEELSADKIAAIPLLQRLREDDA